MNTTFQVTSHLSAAAQDHDLAATAYQNMKHTPESAAVDISYTHFRHETMAQWFDILSSGMRVTFHSGDHDYANSPAMFADMAQNHLYTFLTDQDEAQLPTAHPMLRIVTHYKGRALMLNDVFRAVHDVNGHGRSGGSFALSGEFKAWTTHREMYSREARAALWCETRGQSAWTNRWADHASLPLKDRPFAQQKAGWPPLALV